MSPEALQKLHGTELNNIQIKCQKCEDTINEKLPEHTFIDENEAYCSKCINGYHRISNIYINQILNTDTNYKNCLLDEYELRLHGFDLYRKNIHPLFIDTVKKYYTSYYGKWIETIIRINEKHEQEIWMRPIRHNNYRNRCEIDPILKKYELKITKSHNGYIIKDENTNKTKHILQEEELLNDTQRKVIRDFVTNEEMFDCSIKTNWMFDKLALFLKTHYT